MQSRLIRTVWIVLAVATVIPVVVLVLTWYPPLLQRLAAHGATLLVRAACLAAIGVVALLFVLRDRVNTLLQRLDSHVLAVAAAAPVEAPGVPPRRVARALLLVAAATAVVAVVLAVLSPNAYAALIREDGIVEYGSTLAWFVAAGCGLAALLLERRRSGTMLAFYLPLIALCVLAGGEEISWGQRLAGYHVPQVFIEYNKQGETNLHDFGNISLFENTFFVLTTMCCLVVPLLLQRAPAWRAYLRHLNAPIVDPLVAHLYGIGLAAWVIIGLRFGTLGFSPLSLWHYYTQMDDEIWEFYAAFGFCALTMLDLAHRLQFSRRRA